MEYQNYEEKEMQMLLSFVSKYILVRALVQQLFRIFVNVQFYCTLNLCLFIFIFIISLLALKAPIKN